MLSADSQDLGSLFLLVMNILTSLHMVFISMIMESLKMVGCFSRYTAVATLKNTCKIVGFLFLLFFIYLMSMKLYQYLLLPWMMKCWVCGQTAV